MVVATTKNNVFQNPNELIINLVVITATQQLKFHKHFII